MHLALTKLLTLGIRHIAEEPDAMTRASMFDAAAGVFAIQGSADSAEKLSATAAMIREAEAAQMRLQKVFQ